jgi:hypothetical protein
MKIVEARGEVLRFARSAAPSAGEAVVFSPQRIAGAVSKLISATIGDWALHSGVAA